MPAVDTSFTAAPGGSSDPVPRRFHGLFPDRLLRYRRPLWWQELAIIAFGYWLYDLGRNSVPEQASIALRHGRAVQHFQELLHLNFELSINRFVAAHEPIAEFMNYYYATLHFVVTAAVLIWLYTRRAQVYRGARTALFMLSLTALIGFYVFPLAPPRLLPQFGYLDTVVMYHTWGSLADPNIASHSNQFAAMPSLHIGWALWCGIAVVMCAQRIWVRVLGALYPVGTLIVIIGTANHFVLDAVGGVIAVVIGFGLQWVLSGHGAFEPPPDAPPARVRVAAVGDPVRP
jgi:PAP2 superfamily